MGRQAVSALLEPETGTEGPVSLDLGFALIAGGTC
jgi:hypothetical protein